MAYGYLVLLDENLKPVGGGTISVKVPPAGGSGEVNAKHQKDGEAVPWKYYLVCINVVGKPLGK